MPEIKEYNLRVAPVGPTDVRRATGADFGSEVGEGVQKLGAATSELNNSLYKAKTNSEISDVSAEMAKTHAELSAEYQKQLQDGSLKVEDFSKLVKERTDAVGELANTPEARQYFQRSAATLNGHFLETATIGQAHLTGEKSKNNFAIGVNASTTALLSDPSSFNTTLKLHSDTIDNLVASGQLPAIKADELKLETQNSLAKSALQGWINLNPAIAKQQLASGQWDKYLGTQNVTGGQVKEQMIASANQAERAKEIEDERLQRAHEKIVKQQQQDTQNDFLDRMSQGTLSSKDILGSNLDPFGSGSKEQFLQLLKTSQSEKIKTDPSTFTDIFNRVHLPASDPNAINDENILNGYLGKGLTLDDIKNLRKEMQDKGTQAGDIEGQLKKGLTDIAQGKLTKSNPLTKFKDPIGDANYQRWLSDFLTNYNEQKKKGKTPQELLNPDSPDYMGKTIDRYVRSQTDVIKDTVRALQRPGTQKAGPVPVNVVPPAPRQPGETPDAYLNRIGKGK